MTSETSADPPGPSRPKPKPRKRSSGQVQVVLQDGKAAGEMVDSSSEEWDSDEDGPGTAQASVAQSKGKAKNKIVEATSQAMRRTVSDPQAQPLSRGSGSLATSPLAMQHPSHGHPFQRTTGFAGSHKAAGDPQTMAQRHINENMPHWNDSMHVMPAHQIQHQKSAVSLHNLGSDEKIRLMQREGSDRGQSREGMVMATVRQTSPKSYMTNKSPLGPAEQATTTSSLDDQTPRQRTSMPPANDQRHRTVSEKQGGPRVQKRASNASLRSNRSLRAFPHPLNSPTGYRSGMLGSRPGSSVTSPNLDTRGPSLHQPPIAPPVIYRENATGQGWDRIQEEATTPPSKALPNGPGKQRPRQDRRQLSVSSAQSLQGILRPQSSSPGSSRPNSSSNIQTTPRRRTALEVTSEASKYQTTNDPVLYHQSLGMSSSSAETAHLISRFLPTKKPSKPLWEIDEASDDATADDSHGAGEFGLMRGAYRDAHESLIRSMKEMALPQTRRASRRLSYQSLLGSAHSKTPPGQADGADEIGNVGLGVSVGMVNGRNGPMVVLKGGGWRGKTPFELSLERCLAQRPQRGLGGL